MCKNNDEMGDFVDFDIEEKVDDDDMTAVFTLEMKLKYAGLTLRTNLQTGRTWMTTTLMKG